MPIEIQQLLLQIFYKNNDSMSPKYTSFHHLAYVARWSPTTGGDFLYFKNKLKWGTTLAHRQSGEKLYI
jgi:hypothetical protein